MTKHDMQSLLLITLCGLACIWAIFGSLFFLLTIGVSTAVLSFAVAAASAMFFVNWFIRRETPDDSDETDQ